jgi:hypothetical protein
MTTKDKIAGLIRADLERRPGWHPKYAAEAVAEALLERFDVTPKTSRPEEKAK